MCNSRFQIRETEVCCRNNFHFCILLYTIYYIVYSYANNLKMIQPIRSNIPYPWTLYIYIYNIHMYICTLHIRCLDDATSNIKWQFHWIENQELYDCDLWLYILSKSLREDIIYYWSHSKTSCIPITSALTINRFYVLHIFSCVN